MTEFFPIYKILKVENFKYLKIVQREKKYNKQFNDLIKSDFF